MSDRRINAFFYGLFMDIDVLRNSNVEPVNPRRAYVGDFTLRTGQCALSRLDFPQEYVASVL